MALTLTYPTSAELSQIDQNLLPQLVNNDPIFELFPIRQTTSHLVIWEQRDDYFGLQQVRGFNNDPPSVPPTGWTRYQMSPSAYGEWDAIDELEIISRAAPGTFNVPISIDDLVMERQQKLMTRQVNRQRWILWTLLTTGTFQVLDVKGVVVHADSYIPQVFNASVTWATVATATPLADLRNVQLLHRGYSVAFDETSLAYMNRKTWNNFISNTNANDLGGRKGVGLQSLQSVGEVNSLLTRDGLPNIRIYDEGYKNDSKVWVPWIPDNKALVVGRRLNNAALGAFLLTRSASNPDMSSAPYLRVVDKGANDLSAPPRRIEVHRGCNGGPALYYPSAVVIMNV
jgi:hypothetical protein